ncbi:MAG: hypothetical protein LQ352_003870 [Teloschistes flavicans]|nr:MAG: hypothetical protein LQ352_003870 [Teloschistes flavicans]
MSTQQPSPEIVPSTKAQIFLRPPTTSAHLAKTPSFDPPSTDWLSGTWNVTFSTLPMWKSKRNVLIKYTPFSASSSAEPIPRLDDLVSYQGLSSDKVKTVEGIDTSPSPFTGGEWDWRGKGWLKIASSHWEILGWGDLADGNQWVVIYFAKTLFTPAGLDVFSRRKEGLPEEVMEGIKSALGASKDAEVKSLAGEIFEVVRN